MNIESVLSVEIQVCKVNRIERNQTNLLTRELVSSASKIAFLKIENTSSSLCMNYFAPIAKLFWLTIAVAHQQRFIRNFILLLILQKNISGQRQMQT